MTIYYWDIETTSLDALTPLSRVTMIGIMDEEATCRFFYGESEKALLEEFWQYVKERTATYVGFNVLNFDWIFLYKRSIVLGVKPYLHFKRWILDLRNVLDSDKFAKGTLQNICLLISGEHKHDSLEGQDVIKLFYDGDYETLKIYLTQDLLLTKILYTRLLDCEVLQ